jgi:magnesium-transporting ATPase (P-type)
MLFVVYTRGVLQEAFFWITTATIVTVLIMRLIRGVTFSFRKDISIFYMFLYLCALELVPLALLFRWLKGIL